MQPAAPALPELEMVRQHAITAPMRRTRRALAVLVGEGSPARLEPRAVLDRPALRRSPCADARAQRPRSEIRFALLGGHFFHGSFDPHLALELLPQERER